MILPGVYLKISANKKQVQGHNCIFALANYLFL